MDFGSLRVYCIDDYIFILFLETSADDLRIDNFEGKFASWNHSLSTTQNQCGSAYPLWDAAGWGV